MEIERLVKKNGAKGFNSGWHNEMARVEFLLKDRHIRMTLTASKGLSESVLKQHWRALLLLVKAKFAAVEAGIVTLEQAFIGDVVHPGTGRTVYETIREPLQVAYTLNKDVNLLEGPRQ